VKHGELSIMTGIPHSEFVMRRWSWLLNMDLNHDKHIQSLLCYHYTIRHARSEGQITRFRHGVKQPDVRMNVLVDEWMSGSGVHSSIHPFIHSSSSAVPLQCRGKAT